MFERRKPRPIPGVNCTDRLVLVLLVALGGSNPAAAEHGLANHYMKISIAADGHAGAGAVAVVVVAAAGLSHNCYSGKGLARGATARGVGDCRTCPRPAKNAEYEHIPASLPRARGGHMPSWGPPWMCRIRPACRPGPGTQRDPSWDPTLAVRLQAGHLAWTFRVRKSQDLG